MQDCKYMDGKTCTFEPEVTQEDCLLCMPHAILMHLNLLLASICSLTIEFGHAKNIYTAFDEIRDAQKGLLKLLKEAFPEAVERARIPKEEPTRMDVT